MIEVRAIFGEGLGGVYTRLLTHGIRGNTSAGTLSFPVFALLQADKSKPVKIQIRSAADLDDVSLDLLTLSVNKLIGK